MLVLTAIHDIMKIKLLLPVVQPAHAPYHGFAVGDRINEHDVALAYVLDHYGGALPSYMGVNAQIQRSIRLTQSKMHFNHGWLVQAEAPPGALFSRFRGVLRSGKAGADDVAFYFVHWLTDLAGADPTPLHGSVKFVQRFPHAVLASFIDSFGVVERLAYLTETEVFEEYLERVWVQGPESLQPPPTGFGSVALMRLLTHVQSPQLKEAVATAFRQLPADDHAVLAREMAICGVQGQQYKREPEALQSGPAFLVYYSPAFVRAAAPEDAFTTLRMLAEIYRQARNLWPFPEGSELEMRTVTLYIDQLKEHSVESIQNSHLFGEGWVLSKRNAQEAVVEQVPLYALVHDEYVDASADLHGQRTREFRLLGFWQHLDEGDEGGEVDDQVYELEQMRLARMRAVPST